MAAVHLALVKRTFGGLTKEHVSDNLEELIFELLSQGVGKRMILGMDLYIFASSPCYFTFRFEFISFLR
jgi:hypothetical protein